jgi:hypothetical protein
LIALAQLAGGVACNMDASDKNLIPVTLNHNPKFARELALSGDRFALAKAVIQASPGRRADGSCEVHESSDLDAFEEAAAALENLLARVAKSPSGG